jgi:uncharacterized protein
MSTDATPKDAAPKDAAPKDAAPKDATPTDADRWPGPLAETKKKLDEWYHGHLNEMAIDECWEMIDARTVGRIAFLADEGLSVLPVNYVLADGAVYFMTTSYGSIARHLGGVSRVAFQVDEFDDFNQSGWSVLLRGRAELLGTDELVGTSRPNPWPTGQRTLLVRFLPLSITGRQVLPG